MIHRLDGRAALREPQHLRLEPALGDGVHREVEVANRRADEEIVHVPPRVSDQERRAWTAASAAHHEHLVPSHVPLVTVHVAREHRERLPRADEGRDERALHVELVAGDGAVGERRVVEQDQHAAHAPVPVEAGEGLFEPSSLGLPLIRRQLSLVAVEEHQPQRAISDRVPVASLGQRHPREHVPLRAGAAAPVLVVAERGDHRDTRLAQRPRACVVVGPMSLRAAVKHVVAGDREQLGLRVGDGAHQDRPLVVVGLAPEFGERRPLQITHHRDAAADREHRKRRAERLDRGRVARAPHEQRGGEEQRTRGAAHGIVYAQSPRRVTLARAPPGRGRPVLTYE